MTRWQIRRLEKRESGFVPTDVVAAVEVTADGGRLDVLDEACRDLLEDLFLTDQLDRAAREEVGPGAEATTVRVLKPWHPSTLAVVREKLPRYGLLAEDA